MSPVLKNVKLIADCILIFINFYILHKIFKIIKTLFIQNLVPFELRNLTLF